jgi:hypothetical protein
MPDRTIYLEDVTQLAGNGTTDDSTALQTAILSASPGDAIVCKKGALYRVVTDSLLHRGLPLNGVHLDANNSSFLFEHNTPISYGFRLVNKGQLWGEGLAKTTVSNNANAQRIAHSPVTVGCAYGDEVAPFYSTREWKIGGGLRIETVKPDGSLIGCHGEFEDYLIEDVCFPDSAYAGLGIGMDWAPWWINTSVNTGSITQLRQKFLNGEYYSLHPGAGLINRIRAGALTYAGALNQDGGPTLVRLSAAHDVVVRDIHAKKAAALFRTVGGDVGAEFAPSAMKGKIGKGLRVEHLRLDEQVGNNPVVSINCFADNVAREPSYTPWLDPIGYSGIEVRDVISYKGTTTNDAFKANMVRGAKFVDCSSNGHRRSVNVGDGADQVKVIGGRHSSTYENAIWIDALDAPEDTEIREALVVNSGTSLGHAAIYANRSIRPQIIGNQIGEKSGAIETQKWGVLIDGGCINPKSQDNRVLALAT